MRRVNTEGGDFSLVEYVRADIPRYAILSHTWGKDEDEMSFKDLEQGLVRAKPGYQKFVFCAKQAALTNLRFV
jgi:hypothetical protein